MKMKTIFIFCFSVVILIFFLLAPSFIFAEEMKQNFSEAIEDNSLLVEEAYNQEAGVVQHIFGLTYFPRSPKDLFFTFTQEWPVVTQTHQLSYTIPVSFLDGGSKGLGDVMLNYRYQLFTKKDWAAVAPRLSIIFPTGNNDKGLGFGTTGVQIDFPVSKRWSDHFVTHFNVGGTFLPGVSQTLPTNVQVKKTLAFANLGLSLGWLATKNINVLLEYVTNFSSEIDDSGKVQRFTEFVLNPVVRGAINVGSLQIVPGIGVPLTWNNNGFRTSLFFYLSFEHPFMKIQEK